MMKIKQRYSFEELEEMRNKFNRDASLTNNLKNEKGRARKKIMKDVYTKSYSENDDLLNKASELSEKKFASHEIMQDYLIGYNIALEEESLDHDILDESEQRLKTLSTDLGIAGLFFTSFLHGLLSLAIFQFLSNRAENNLTYVLAVFLPLIVSLMFLYLKKILFKEGIKDGARFNGELSESSRKSISIFLHLGAASVGIIVAAVSIALFPMAFLTEAGLNLPEFIKIGSGILIFILAYILSYFDQLNKNRVIILSLLLSVVLAIIL